MTLLSLPSYLAKSLFPGSSLREVLLGEREFTFCVEVRTDTDETRSEEIIVAARSFRDAYVTLLSEHAPIEVFWAQGPKGARHAVRR